MSTPTGPKRSVIRIVFGVLFILGGLRAILMNLPPTSSYQMGAWTGAILLIVLGVLLLRPKKAA
jgi:hypothetical protein